MNANFTVIISSQQIQSSSIRQCRQCWSISCEFHTEN